jgi:peptidoglycan/xylan/chitin deacetylase (PgdA/CDA1 family)
MSSLKNAVERAGRIADRIVPPPTGITVLIYHRVGGGSDSAVDLEPDEFERQLEHLAEHHRVISLADAVDEISQAQPEGWATGNDDVRGTPGVVLTFDDGTDDFVDVVAPLLERHRTPATLYAATQFIDECEAFPWGAAPATWAGLADSTSSGLITVESHTHTHLLFDRIDSVTAATELDRSIDLIGEHIGVAPAHFAYPKAVPPNASAEIEVRKRFVSAALARSRVNRPGHTDLARLWRTPIQRNIGHDAFARRAAGGQRLEGELRALTTPIRHRRAAT